MAIHITRLNGGNIVIGTDGGSSGHPDTWYKYANDTEWRAVSISGAIIGGDSSLTTQIPDAANVVELEVGTNVTSIGDGAFGGSRNLMSVTIPDSVTSIGISAFSGCYNVTSITFGNGVESIGSMAFGDCSSITNITIPDSVTIIESYAFHMCSSLTNITIPDSVTLIGTSAFGDSYGLTSVTITDNGGDANNVKQMMIDAGVDENITWNMPS